MGLLRYAVTRVLLTIPMVLILLTVVFLVLHVMPGNPVLVILGGRNVPVSLIHQYEHRLGFDQPIYVQYLKYLWGVAHGNLGESFSTGRSVASQIALHLPVTLELSLSGLVIAALIGVSTGIWAALNRGGFLDQVLRFTHIGTYATRMSQGAMGFFTLGWYPDFMDPDNFLAPWLTDATQSLGTFWDKAPDFSQYKSLITQARAATSQDARATAYQQVQKLSATDVPFIPLWQNTFQGIAFTQPGVSGMVINPAGDYRIATISKQ
ncbi:MAG TPA: hypothetical protein VKB31_06770 [Trueperaceae bacterium]|nr:hypothetical protein [Trueperaceae bacterium]